MVVPPVSEEYVPFSWKIPGRTLGRETLEVEVTSEDEDLASEDEEVGDCTAEDDDVDGAAFEDDDGDGDGDEDPPLPVMSKATIFASPPLGTVTTQKAASPAPTAA
jgi:hypothetical protein